VRSRKWRESGMGENQEVERRRKWREGGSGEKEEVESWRKNIQ
jgi:hypothetical protein